MRGLARSFFARDALVVAPDLLGCLLVGPDGQVGRLVEVEAYRAADDPGSHAFRGPTPRNAPMWGPAGHLYVYLIYGMHHCANVVTGPVGSPQAVLLRAAWPEAGAEVMSGLRRSGTRRAVAERVVAERDLCRGPGRLAQAFGMTRADDGADLCWPGGRYRLVTDGRPLDGSVVASSRVGLSAGQDLPWRFAISGHRGVSAPAPRR